jgi:hypothetical protein
VIDQDHRIVCYGCLEQDAREIAAAHNAQLRAHWWDMHNKVSDASAA